MSGMIEAKADARRAAVKRAMGLCFALLCVCLLWDLAGWAYSLDLRISAAWGSEAGFPWKDHAWWGLRVYTMERALGWACMLVLCLYALLPDRWLGRGAEMPRQQRIWMLATVIVALLWIQWLKRHSSTSCPWDLAQFGAHASYVPHWLWSTKDAGPGRCFPAGHPSAAWAYVAVPAFVSLHSQRWSRRILGMVCVFALVLGFTQVMRGAHFVSHVLWTGWWCSLIATASLALFAQMHGQRRP